MLFSALILRLGIVQIVNGDEYKQQVDQTDDHTVSYPVPRGKIHDRTGKIVVDNTGEKAIIFTNWGYKPTEILATAKKLSKIIDMDPSKIQERDKKDYWILTHMEEAKDLVSKQEDSALKKKYEDKDDYNKAFYKAQLSKVTENEINGLSSNDLKILAIFREMTSGYAYTPQIIKNKGVSDKEFAIISENLHDLPGVDTTTDWLRAYPYDMTLRTVLGKVTTSEEGLPADQIDQYLAKDYSRNDRVGKSYLEMQYEDVLSGQKKKVLYKKDKSGEIVKSETLTDGQRGKDVVLTIDMDLQKQVEQIIENVLWDTKRGNANTRFLDRAFVVLMDPHTGDVLTMAGKMIGKNEQTGQPEMRDFALGTITTSYNVGSAVKGATVLTGYQAGAIKPGSPQVDAPMKIKGTPVKKSYKNFGTINDLRALQVSSNVYMFKTAIAIAGGHYVPNQSLGIKDLPKAFATMRDSYAQFGLGVRTGIDLPNEMAGFKGPNTSLPGYLMDLSIGQYDTYTTMQLAQYASTIANGGYRIQPHIVKEIRDPAQDKEQLGPLIKEIQPNVLSRLSMEDSWIKRVQTGFRMVMQPGGTGGATFGSANYSPAGKTGTAQSFYDGPERAKYPKNSPPEVMNVSLVSYAPSDNPEVAMAVIVPWVYTGPSGPSPNMTIGRQVMDAYFALKNSRAAQSVETVVNP